MNTGEAGALSERHRDVLRRVAQYEGLRALVEVSSTVINDINNALTPIVGVTEDLLEDPNPGADAAHLRESLKTILSAAMDAREISHRLEGFHLASDRLPKSLVQPAPFVQAALRAVPLPSGIEAATELGAVPSIEANADAIVEALTHLIRNAVDAMPSGGKLGIRVSQDADQVVVSVSDTGEGMTDDTREKCIDPFFSTRGSDHVGVGLTLVNGIVTEHGGSLHIASRPGEGTRVSIFLPTAGAASARPSLQGRESTTKKLRILTVDDDPASCGLIQRILTKDGHTVDVAQTARDGLSKFQEQPYDLVTVDQSMKDLTGDQLADMIKAIAPKTPILLITGFGELMRDRKEHPESVDAILPKPVSPAELRRAVAMLVER